MKGTVTIPKIDDPSTKRHNFAGKKMTNKMCIVCSDSADVDILCDVCASPMHNTCKRRAAACVIFGKERRVDQSVICCAECYHEFLITHLEDGGCDVAECLQNRKNLVINWANYAMARGTAVVVVIQDNASCAHFGGPNLAFPRYARRALFPYAICKNTQ